MKGICPKKLPQKSEECVQYYKLLFPFQSLYGVSHETCNLVKSLECLFPLFVKLFDTKDQLKYYMGVILY